MENQNEEKTMESDSTNTTPPVPNAGNPHVYVQTKDERMWAMFCHLSSLAGLVVPIPFANVIGPLVVWMIKKDDYPLVNDQGKESINFQISLAIYFVVSFLLVFIVIGFFLLIGLAIFQLICVIMASIKANEGEKYRYPLCIRFIS